MSFADEKRHDEMPEVSIRIDVEDMDFAVHDPGRVGYLQVEGHGDGVFSFRAAVRAEATVEARLLFKDFIVERVARFIRRGPHPDDWFADAEDRWHTWCRVVVLPDMSFLDDPALLLDCAGEHEQNASRRRDHDGLS